MERPTCVLADDHDVVREGIRLRLEQDGWLDVVGEASTGNQAIELILAVEPDLALVDLRIPGVDGIGIAAAVRDAGIKTRVVIFSAFGGPSLVERAFTDGAHGYLTKEAPSAILMQALRAVHEGKRFLDPTIAADVLNPQMQSLSAREQQILEMISQGMQNGPIGSQLNIAPETVKTHVSNILQKLEADSRTAAVAIGLRHSIIE